MREIKFRAWDDNHRQMYVPKIGLDGRVIVCYRGVELEATCDDPLMQYTGLKDKNGVEIYEGDVVEVGMGRIEPTALQVEWGGTWRYAAFGLHGKRKNRGDDNWETEYSWDVLNPETASACRVIGNIYENPELMEDNNE